MLPMSHARNGRITTGLLKHYAGLLTEVRWLSHWRYCRIPQCNSFT